LAAAFLYDYISGIKNKPQSKRSLRPS